MRDTEDKSGDSKKSGSLWKRGKDVTRISCFCSGIQKHAVQQQLTWNLEPRWDDCKVGGRRGQERENEVLERVSL